LDSERGTPTRTRARRPNAATRARQTVEGTLRITPAGFGLVKAGGDDVFIPPASLGASLDGDAVEVGITSRGERGPRGKVLRVVARTPRRLCGVVDEGGSFVPDDARFARPLRCAEDGEGPRDGRTLFGAELLPDVGPDLPEVRIEQGFGDRGDPRTEENALLWREHVREGFPRTALVEAKAQAHAVYDTVDPHRVDWRRLAFITIDPATAEDHDDALFAKRLPDGTVRVFVAIADVSAFVLPGSALDVEARRRSASLYLPGRVVPMLPPILSNRAASLVPGRERAAMVLELRLDKDARVQNHRLVLARIRSRAKLTYEGAGEVLESHGDAGPDDAKAHADTILLLDELAQRLRTQRRERGAIAVAAGEVVIETDQATGLPIGISRTAHGPCLSRAHQLVEEMMLLANETVATVLRERRAKVLFRVHEAPSDERTARLVEAARAHGLDIDALVARDPVALRSLVRDVPDRALRDELSALLLEALPSAVYAAERQDHFALASRQYVHFTSPIRRYADLTIHRAIRAMIAGETIESSDDDVDDVNRGQLRARTVQREVHELYAALLMQRRLGDTFDGVILRMMKSEWIVGLDEPAVCVRCVRPEAAAEEGIEEGARVTVRIEGVSIASRTIDSVFVARPAD
jgi:ribonuclease R